MTASEKTSHTILWHGQDIGFWKCSEKPANPMKVTSFIKISDEENLCLKFFFFKRLSLVMGLLDFESSKRKLLRFAYRLT